MSAYNNFIDLATAEEFQEILKQYEEEEGMYLIQIDCYKAEDDGEFSYGEAYEFEDKEEALKDLRHHEKHSNVDDKILVVIYELLDEDGDPEESIPKYTMQLNIEK